MFFMIMGAVSAAESIDVSDTEDSNLIGDNDDSLSTNNKLEISSEDSISETNIVNSHDDNLGNYPDEEALNASADSYYEDNNQVITSNGNEVDQDVLSSSGSSSDSVLTVSSSDDTVGAASSTKASVKSTKLAISNAHYGKSSTYFKVTLKDNSGNPLSNQKITLKVNKKSYTAYTNANGIASIKAGSLKVGTYAVTVTYGGSSAYSSSSLSKKVKVLSSAVGSDLTKTFGYTSKYSVTFWKDNSPLTNTKVSFVINGKTYTKTTDSKGVASVNINLAVGKYKVTTTNPYSNEKVTHKITVKKEKTSIDAKAKTYIHANKKGSFTVTLKSKHNALLKNKKVTFTYNNKTVTSKTNANGKATITIPVLAKGTYKIKYSYKGSDNYYSDSGSAKLVVAKATTKMTSKIMVVDYKDGSHFKIKLTDKNGKELANKEVKVKFNGVTKTYKTNKYGNVHVPLKNVKPGNYLIKYYHSTKGNKDYSSGSNRAIILKLDAKVSAKDLTMNANDGSEYKVTVKDKSGKALGGVYVKSVIGGKQYLYKTDANGVAKLKITQGAGSYSVKTYLADPCYKSSVSSKNLLVKGTKFIAKNIYVSAGDKATFSVKLVNEKNKVVGNKDVTFTYEGKETTVKTDSKGIAKVSLGVVSKGTHNIKFSQGTASGSAKIFAANKVSIKEIVEASKNVNKYISNHAKLPSTVKIGDISLKTADYLYLASKAIVNIKAGNTKDIPIKILNNPTKAKAATNMGYLKNYLSVAKSVVKTAESKGKLPDSANSKVGTIGYQGLVSTFSKVLASYGKNNKMPSYIAVKSLSGSSTSIKGPMNMKNTITALAAYLAASKNCEVNDAAIKKLVTKLTKNCKTEKEKANAIFTYVRDKISYSFYYNTKYGAAGTLKTKSGNCVDQAHLTVAMFRAAGLATRYVHAKCTFTSGHTYGHVFAQVLIGNTWTVADTTSSRNSLGKVANWNTNTYRLESFSSSISF